MSTVDAELEIRQQPVVSPGLELTGSREARVGDMTGIGGFEITVFLGSLSGAESPARVFSEIVGAEIIAARAARATIPLIPAYEHVMFVTAGSAEVEGTALSRGRLLYLGTGREQASVAAVAGSRMLLLGGVPLGESLLMWWNFVARTPEEIAAAVADWREGRFGRVGGYDGDPLPAPPLVAARLRAPRSSS